MSKIHFVGGEKGGVGKSVVARLLVQWAIDKQLPFAAVDADESHGALLRHYAPYTRAVDLARPESADEIVSLALDADRRVIVDLPAQSDRLVAAWLAEAGVLDLLQESKVDVIFWHVMDDGKDAIATLGRLLERHAGAARERHERRDNVRFVVVENLGRGKEFSLFDRSAARAAASAAGAVTIHLPEPNAPAMRKVDRSDGSFWAAVNNLEFGA